MSHEVSRRSLIGGSMGLAALAATTVADASAESARSGVSDLYPNPRTLKTPGKYYAQGTVFTRSVQGSDFPVDPRTPQFRESIMAMPKKYGFSQTTSYEDYARNIPIWITDTRKPGYNTINMKQYALVSMQPVQSGKIPAPPFVSAAWGNDKEMALYDLGLGYMRDYYICDNDGKGNWQSQNGGYSKANPGLTNLASTNFWMQLLRVDGTLGTAAAVGMHTEASQVGLDEELYGRIAHAVGFMMSNSAPGFSFPAQAGDGYWTDSVAPVEGQWFRIPPSVNVYDLGLTPWELDVCIALQTFGGFGYDRNTAPHSVIYDSPFYDLSVNSTDPWKEIFAARGMPEVDVRNLPWHLVEWAAPDWKGTAQASPIELPLKYYTYQWKMSSSGMSSTSNTGIGSLNLHCGDVPSGSNGSVTFTRAMSLSKATTYVVPTTTMITRSNSSSVSASVDGKVVARASSRGSSGRSLKFTVPAGNHSVALSFMMPNGDSDSVTMGPMFPQS